MNNITLADFIDYLIDFGCPDEIICSWIKAYKEGKELKQVNSIPSDDTPYVVFNSVEIYVAI